MLDDRFEELEKIFEERIKELKTADHDKLMKLCEAENFDVEDMTDEEIRVALFDYYSEEVTK